MGLEMKTVAVQGLWHLGTVTSVCLATLGIKTIAFSYNELEVKNVEALNFPVYEPKLKELAATAIQKSNLIFELNYEKLNMVDALWVAYDTPVDEQDQADINFVIQETLKSLSYLKNMCFVVVSSQLPVGTIKQLSLLAKVQYPKKTFRFIAIPENLRLGSAVDNFLYPDRIIVGASPDDFESFLELIQPLANKCVNVLIESAELTKHAINAFLALSVVYANEIAAVAEIVGADSNEVAACLKSESRIGPKAYLNPGLAFGGGTLARDVEFLKAISRTSNHNEIIFSALKQSNDKHKEWVLDRVKEIFGYNLTGLRFKILGLAYKPGTNSIRRSTAVDICNALLERGAILAIHDPMVREFPVNWTERVHFIESPRVTFNANIHEDAIVVLTDWPEYRNLSYQDFGYENTIAIVIDPTQHLMNLKRNRNVKYYSIGYVRKV